MAITHPTDRIPVPQVAHDPNAGVRPLVRSYRRSQITQAELIERLAEFAFLDRENPHEPFSEPWWHTQAEISADPSHRHEIFRLVDHGYLPAVVAIAVGERLNWPNMDTRYPREERAAAHYPEAQNPGGKTA
jgi:hypothetical protein